MGRGAIIRLSLPSYNTLHHNYRWLACIMFHHYRLCALNSLLLLILLLVLFIFFLILLMTMVMPFVICFIFMSRALYYVFIMTCFLRIQSWRTFLLLSCSTWVHALPILVSKCLCLRHLWIWILLWAFNIERWKHIDSLSVIILVTIFILILESHWSWLLTAAPLV